MNTNLRNVAIVLVVAAAVAVLPGGGRAANLVAALLSIVFAVLLAYFAGRQYLEHRLDIYGLEEKHRAMLYGAIAGLLVTLAAASRLAATGAGALGLIVLLSLCGYSLFYVYRAWRRY